ncbi:MAG: T9SS type A sorting domain-containing protein [Bacteroidota bacterium]|nr:T9SS type A sorting domain-containing protein [Bacteroidota bacterium]
MKKIYLLGFASMFALAVNAQTTMKVKNPLKKSTTTGTTLNKPVKGVKASTAKNVGGPNSVQQVASTIVCNTPYVAGTTMDLSFTFTMTNTDAEYGDLLTITFPAGITPTGLGNTSDPFPNTEDAGGGLEALNAPIGQDISWGVDNNDQYGGIFSSTGITFVVEVTVAPGTTGALNASYTLSGDGYGATPGDQGATTFAINEQQPVNMAVIQAGFYAMSGSLITSGCGLVDGYVVVVATNNGSSTITVGTPGDSLSYVVNASTTTVAATNVSDLAGNPVATIAPGDTVIILDLTPVDFSTPGAYSLDASVSYVGSGDANASDDAAANYTITHFTSFDATAAPYTMGFESPADDALFAAWSFPATNMANWSVFNQFVHTGAQNLVKFGTAGDDDWAITGCIDLVGGNTYDLSFWMKYYDLASVADMSVYYGTSADVAGMTNLVSANPMALPADTIYYQYNYSIVPATTGTYYIGFHAVSATGSSATIFDDINLTYSPVSIKENLKMDAISIFPNPNNGVFTVKANENNSSVEVYSIIGENVYSNNLVKGNNSVDLSGLAAGSYIVKVKSATQTISKRVVINK